jgi:hypothetical protein
MQRLGYRQPLPIEKQLTSQRRPVQLSRRERHEFLLAGVSLSGCGDGVDVHVSSVIGWSLRGVQPDGSGSRGADSDENGLAFRRDRSGTGRRSWAGPGVADVLRAPNSRTSAPILELTPVRRSRRPAHQGQQVNSAHPSVSTSPWRSEAHPTARRWPRSTAKAGCQRRYRALPSLRPDPRSGWRGRRSTASRTRQLRRRQGHVHGPLQRTRLRHRCVGVGDRRVHQLGPPLRVISEDIALEVVGDLRDREALQQH